MSVSTIAKAKLAFVSTMDGAWKLLILEYGNLPDVCDGDSISHTLTAKAFVISVKSGVTRQIHWDYYYVQG